MNPVAPQPGGPPALVRATNAATARSGGVSDFPLRLRAAEADDRLAAARAAAAQLVSEVFVEPVLASLRDHSFGAGPFAPSGVEKRFGPMLDQEIADRVSRGARLPLVDEVARRLVGRALANNQAGPRPEASLALDA